jgi:hypothetical protein
MAQIKVRNGAPMTNEIDGQQYMAVLAGGGGRAMVFALARMPRVE